MAKVRLLRKSNTYDKNVNSYRMILEVLSSENIKKEVFVNQRLRNYTKKNFEDLFVAVATPAQLEDFDVGSPQEGSSYFLSSKIDVVSRNADYLNDVFDSILNEVQKLVGDVEALNELEADGIYTVEADQIDVNMAIQHTHYRLPLYARPCGINTLYDDNGTMRHTVGSPDTGLYGWLNADGTTPAGFKFRYNIPTDTSLNVLWPIDSDKIAYAHLESNGISLSTSEVRINADGIFWKHDEQGKAPWPEDYVNPGDTGDPENQVILILDFIN